MSRFLRLGAAAVVALVLAACGDDGVAAAPDDGRLVVVTTVSPITSIAANVIGDVAQVRGVVPEGSDSHTFEPSPSVSEVLQHADVLFANGLGLEEPTLALAGNVAHDAVIVQLGDRTLSPERYRYDFSFPEDGGRPNPHLWTDPTLAAEYARHIAETMAELDPENASEYRTNLERFEAIIDDFDGRMRDALHTVPEPNRKLLTYHDAYAYWADTYGWTVIGAVQVADFGDPSPRELARLIDQVRAAGVPAIFGSEVFPSPVLERIAAETDVRYVADLRDDDLPGAPGDPDHSYLGLMKFNYVTIVDALGGDASALEAFEVRDAAVDEARYPQ